MSQKPGNFIRYSFSFKQQVVKEIEEEGLSIFEAKRRYGINGAETIQGWLRKFGRDHLLNRVIRIETMEEKDRIKKLEQENRRLKQELAEKLFEKEIYEKLIAEVNKEYKTDVKKNFDTKSSISLKDKGK
ncbi:MAG TPA: transposase [Flavobacterium sp.]|nr:transposase [Flavobacterium sp.]